MFAAYGGYKVLAIDYRMSPEAPFPAAMDDATAAWRTVAATTDPRRIAIEGASAGGGMVLALMLRAKAEGLSTPGAVAPCTPWSDMTQIGDSYKTNEWVDNVLVTYDRYLGRAAKLYANGHDLKDPQLSPIYGDFHGLPPAILTAGTRDLFLSNTVRVHRKMRDAGVDADLELYEALTRIVPVRCPADRGEVSVPPNHAFLRRASPEVNSHKDEPIAVPQRAAAAVGAPDDGCPGLRRSDSGL